jgi:hypothetical protein
MVMVGSLWKPREFYIIELMNSYFHLCEHGYHHDRVDVDDLAAGTVDVNEDLVALYLGYYDWGSLHLVVGVLDSDSLPFVNFMYITCVACDTCFV